MKDLIGNIQIRINDKIYLKDPETSDLGKKIIGHSILLIDEIGFEAFTFKKLATEISSTEASIYRYFENKHKLLVYLLAWYWTWLEYKLFFATNGIQDADDKLKIAIKTLTQPKELDHSYEHINEIVLHKIVVSESSKAYLTKVVDEECKEGYFSNYERLCKRVSKIILEVNPDYQYPNTLVSTIVESSNHQQFFAEHLPSITEMSSENNKDITAFTTDLVFKVLK